MIDPWLKSLSFWDGERPVACISSYAVHPMSTYGAGKVSADFPGLARSRRQADEPDVFQIYFTGCAGDTTAGKYNTHQPEFRQQLADRLVRGDGGGLESDRRRPIEQIAFRRVELRLPLRDAGNFTAPAMRRDLADAKLGRWQRISAALGLSWRERVARAQPIDVPCLDLGSRPVRGAAGRDVRRLSVAGPGAAAGGRS